MAGVDLPHTCAAEGTPYVFELHKGRLLIMMRGDWNICTTRVAGMPMGTFAETVLDMRATALSLQDSDRVEVDLDSGRLVVEVLVHGKENGIKVKSVLDLYSSEPQDFCYRIACLLSDFLARQATADVDLERVMGYFCKNAPENAVLAAQPWQLLNSTTQQTVQCVKLAAEAIGNGKANVDFNRCRQTRLCTLAPLKEAGLLGEDGEGICIIVCSDRGHISYPNQGDEWVSLVLTEREKGIGQVIMDAPDDDYVMVLQGENSRCAVHLIVNETVLQRFADAWSDGDVDCIKVPCTMEHWRRASVARFYRVELLKSSINAGVYHFYTESRVMINPVLIGLSGLYKNPDLKMAIEHFNQNKTVITAALGVLRNIAMMVPKAVTVPQSCLDSRARSCGLALLLIGQGIDLAAMAETSPSEGLLVADTEYKTIQVPPGYYLNQLANFSVVEAVIRYLQVCLIRGKKLHYAELVKKLIQGYTRGAAATVALFATAAKDIALATAMPQNSSGHKTKLRYETLMNDFKGIKNINPPECPVDDCPICSKVKAWQAAVKAGVRVEWIKSDDSVHFRHPRRDPDFVEEDPHIAALAAAGMPSWHAETEAAQIPPPATSAGRGGRGRMPTGRGNGRGGRGGRGGSGPPSKPTGRGAAKKSRP